MKKRVFRPTEAQKRTLARLRLFLGDKGCFIFDVAERFRRKRIDFLAMPKKKGSELPDTLVRVRPTRRGRIIVQGFGGRHSYVHLIENQLKEFRESPTTEVTVYWHHMHLPFFKEEKWGGWYNYFTKKQLREVLLFTRKEKRRPFD